MELADLAERLEKFEDAFQYRAYAANYYGTLYDIHREVGLHTPPVAVDSEQVKKVIRSAWVGANYSARIWQNTERLAGELKSTMERAVHRGDSIQKLSKDLARRMEVGYNNAERLVRTELNFIQNKAALDSITDAGLDCYRFVSALDNRTCPRCGSLDGQVFEVIESMPGENFPPMHPRCRCTIVPTLGEQTGKRTSKVKGERVKIPQSMTFTEWKKVYVDKENVKIESELSRRNNNGGVFAELEIPMQKKAVKRICKKYGVDISFLRIKIQRDENLLNFDIAGSAAPESIGRIDLFPNAFKNETELLQTIIHEGCHVKQFQKYGSMYVQENQTFMERIAYRYEEFFLKILKRRATNGKA